ncbi:MAG TPA: hypothetical protein VJY66_00815 [Acholeplasma sp.]|nr:hypothetical protein [Acholeplasma sp.]
MGIENNKYIMNHFQSKKPFSSFLSGVAGKAGIPIWAFYVNRGQAITSFGIRDKNGAIMEFHPANKAYFNTKYLGFRTFIKVDGVTHEFFSDESQTEQMVIEKDKLTIVDSNQDIGIKVTVTYATLPNETLGALIRRVKIENLNLEEKHIEVLDGLTQILPSGIDYGGYKAVSNLLQSWMDADISKTQAFYKLRASTADSAVVDDVEDGHFMISKVTDVDSHIFIDTKMIFDYDTSFEKPIGFINMPMKKMMLEDQVHINQVLCGYVGFESTLKNDIIINTLYGYTHDKNQLDIFSKKVTDQYINEKFLENHELIELLTRPIDVKTNHEVFDQYMKQNYLDNLLRGGVPYVFNTLDGDVAYHLFSRKHGDLERDYNFYVIEPEYYSQGNGNFRDVLQNRRNDILFHPEIKHHNIRHFFSLIQADGYNPLSIEGLKFNYQGAPIEILDSLLKNSFSPGQVIKQLIDQSHTFESAEAMLIEVLKNSTVEISANFGEGYWQDHFTYLYDLLETFFKVYPEQIEYVLFDDCFYKFFNSSIYVKPRDEKYVLTKNNKIRQYHSIKHLEEQPKWLKQNDKDIKVNLYSKMITLVLTKYGLLDPQGIGISYEADKPGWNDAMNGLPGLFASGVSEMIELKKLVDYLVEITNEYKDKKVGVIKALLSLKDGYLNINAKSDFNKWDLRYGLLEQYRKELLNGVEIEYVRIDDFKKVLNKMATDLFEALQKAKNISQMLPTYLTYEVTSFDLIKVDKENKLNEQKLPLVKATSFKLMPITEFLESPARYLKLVKDKKEAKEIYDLVKQSELYDDKMQFYQTSRPLDSYSNEIGRIRAFTKGWLERESNFLHMTYKYLLGVLKSGLYEDFYNEIPTNMVCFMDETIYGRSPLENSSFIVTSTNPDVKRHGQGFVSRLSGSTAEMLSIYHLMFFGKELFGLVDGKLTLKLKPILPKSFFKDNKVTVKLFNSTVVYHNPDNIDTYDKNAVIDKIILTDGKKTVEFKDLIFEEQALSVRNKDNLLIEVYIKREETK